MRLSTFFDLDRVADFLRSDRRDLITDVVEKKPLSRERPTVICCVFQRSEDDFTCLRQLRLYKKLNFNLLVVSNSAVSAGLRAELDRIVNVLIVRENVGYDFAAYRCGVLYLNSRLGPVKNFVIICNDSCFGPYQNEEMFSLLLDSEELILKGMTDSYRCRQYHLQSYWLFLTSSLFNSEIFNDFVSTIKNLRSKNSVVSNYEVGLSKFMLERDVKLTALFPYFAIRETEVSKFKYSTPKLKNPTIHLGFDLFINNNFPFLKKKLIERNKSSIHLLMIKNEFRDEIKNYINI